MPNPNNCQRYWDLADHIRIDDAIALWCGVEPTELASLNFETQCMSAKRAALVIVLRTEHLEYVSGNAPVSLPTPKPHRDRIARDGARSGASTALG